MGKVIEFPMHRVELSQLMKLKETSDRIDQVIIQAVRHEGIDPHELAGVLAHRLGCLMRTIDDKSQLWDVCEKVLKKQAVID